LSGAAGDALYEKGNLINRKR